MVSVTPEISGAGMGVAAGIVCSNAGVGAGRGASSCGGGINVTVLAGTSGADSKEAGIIAGDETGFNSTTGATFSSGGTTTGDWVAG